MQEAVLSEINTVKSLRFFSFKNILNRIQSPFFSQGNHVTRSRLFLSKIVCLDKYLKMDKDTKMPTIASRFFWEGCVCVQIKMYVCSGNGIHWTCFRQKRFSSKSKNGENLIAVGTGGNKGSGNVELCK